jgi:beta-glucosidase
MQLSGTHLGKSGSVTVRLTVSNMGEWSGDEVVQLYVQHLGSSIPRPAKELKGFRRVAVPRGGSAEVRFELKAQDLAYWDETSGHWQVEKDKVTLMIGGASDAIRWQGTVNVEP